MLAELNIYSQGFTDFQNFCCTYYDKFSEKYYLENILPPYKLNINYLRKFIQNGQNQHISNLLPAINCVLV